MTSIAPASSARLGPPRDRTVVLVGLMGVGKSSIGKRLAQALNLPFSDADAEIEAAAGRSIADIFAERGEAEFRDGERRVIARLLEEPCWPPAAAHFRKATPAPSSSPKPRRCG
jgi:shikimate kinase